MARIESWAFVTGQLGDFRKPEDVSAAKGKGAYLGGNIYDHPKGPTTSMQGEPCTTSRVMRLDTQRMRAKTRNTEYELGAIHPLFQQFLQDNGLTLASYEPVVSAAAAEILLDRESLS